MARGRPKKGGKRNIQGLRNQKRERSPSPASSQDQDDQSYPQKRRRGAEGSAESDSEQDWDPCLAADGDSTKVVGYFAAIGSDEPNAEGVEECDDEWEDSLDDEAFCENMISMSSKMSCEDEDWVPYRLQWIRNK
jgi:hypothetical protein